jgi:choline-glycine betaine transporter
MNRLFKWLKREIIDLLPPVLFFLVALNLMYWIENLFLEDDGISLTDFLAPSIGALIVGKVLLIVDMLAVVNVFQNRPLIYSALWKTFLYSLVAFVFRAGEAFIPLALETRDVPTAFGRYLAETHWPRFWATQAFLTMVLFVFVASREFVLAVGTSRARQLFFGR